MILAPSDAFYFHAETRTLTARWATAMEVPSDAPLTIDELRAHFVDRLPGIPWASWRFHAPPLGIGFHDRTLPTRG